MVKKVTQPMLPGMPRNRDLLTDETRYKRGYTPERKREVVDAFKHTEFDVLHHSYGIGPKRNTMTHSLAVEGNNPELRKTDPKRANSLLGRTKHFKDSFVSTVASSSVPIQHINSVNRVVGGVNFDHEDVQGRYDAGKSNLHLKSDLKTVDKTRNHAKHTIMHELGHHATLPPLSDTKYENSSQAGHYEAEADNYADRYPAKGQKLGPTGYDNLVKHGRRSEEFSSAHQKNRIPPPDGPNINAGSLGYVLSARFQKNKNNVALPFPDLHNIEGSYDDRMRALYKSQQTKKQRAERKQK